MRTLPFGELSGAAQVGQVAASLKAGGDLFHAWPQPQALSTIQHTCMSMLLLSHVHTTMSLSQCRHRCHSATPIVLYHTVMPQCHPSCLSVQGTLLSSWCCCQCGIVTLLLSVSLSRCQDVIVGLRCCSMFLGGFFFQLYLTLPLSSCRYVRHHCHAILHLLSGSTWQAQGSIKLTCAQIHVDCWPGWRCKCSPVLTEVKPGSQGVVLFCGA